MGQTVERPARDPTQQCPWIIEVFVDPRLRRRGYATALLVTACRAIMADGAQRVGLSVEVDNVPARELYRSLGVAPTQWGAVQF